MAIDGVTLPGTTPNIYTDVLIGDHTITLTKPGCASIEQRITVEEGQILPLDFTLQDDAETLYNIGLRYYNGDSVPQDYAKAVDCFRQAAEQGDAVAQYKLGVCYDIGLGINKNYNKPFNGIAKPQSKDMLQLKTTSDIVIIADKVSKITNKPFNGITKLLNKDMLLHNTTSDYVMQKDTGCYTR